MGVRTQLRPTSSICSWGPVVVIVFMGLLLADFLALLRQGDCSGSEFVT